MHLSDLHCSHKLTHMYIFVFDVYSALFTLSLSGLQHVKCMCVQLCTCKNHNVYIIYVGVNDMILYSDTKVVFAFDRASNVKVSLLILSSQDL